MGDRFVKMFGTICVQQHGILLFAVVGVLCLYRWMAQRNQTRKRQQRVSMNFDKEAPVEALVDFDWKSTQLSSLREFKPIYNISMGNALQLATNITRELTRYKGIKIDAPSNLITVDEGYLDRINYRQKLTAEYADTVLGVVPGGEAPVAELYDYLLRQYLPVRFPAMFQLSARDTLFTNLVTGRSFPTKPPADTLKALRILGEVVEEDLVFLMPSSEGLRMVAHIWCFPSGFDPVAKLGNTLDAIHKPVPSYDKIGPSMQRFLSKLKAGKPIKRTNWSVQSHPELFDCDANPRLKDSQAVRSHDIKMEDSFLRSELQTLSRLPSTQSIVFLIKTYMYNVFDIKAEGLGPQFADAIEGLKKGNAPGMWSYKDIPRSLEEAQIPPGQAPLRRILSDAPISTPFPTPEPKDAGARLHDQEPAALLADLMAGAAVKGALDILQESYTGAFCLPRISRQDIANITDQDQSTHLIPENSHYLRGTVEDRRADLVAGAPSFDLIVLDPPWPNRSAKRKRGGYATVSNLTETRSLLSRIPIASHLAADGIVAIWVTNKPSLIELLTAQGTGMLAEWGLELVTEWTWLKITTQGEPIFNLDSTWRKPWERLLIARRAGSQIKVPQRVMLAVPDIHSRKPNLRPLFEDLLPNGFVGLEIFARNLTAGWWSWGNEVLRFQARDQWVASPQSR
ncbi:hypothetical protein ACHAQH_006003 [Verticillium albo-atrum]